MPSTFRLDSKSLLNMRFYKDGKKVKKEDISYSAFKRVLRPKKNASS